MRFDNLYGCALNREGKRLACGHYERAHKENRITVYAVPSGEVLWEIPAPSGEFVRSLAWSADGRKLACTHAAGFAVLDGQKGVLGKNFGSPFAHEVCWSPEGDLLACADGQQGVLRLVEQA